ncbi:MAG: hypothetical protein WC352_09295 [Candidatus Omnitrophota bacterium]|jgi:hypothetical protein
MFGAFKQIQLMHQLMKDENFKKLMGHPRVQELFRDPEFLKALQTKDAANLMSHPGLAKLQEDPELREMIGKLDLSKLKLT